MSIAGLVTLRCGLGQHGIPADMNHRRIAFVYAPDRRGDSSRLETMPFAINTIMRLAAAEWKVDVFLWERPHVDYHEIFAPTVRLRYQLMPKRIFFGIRPIQLTARFMSLANYECAFGLGQIGSYLGAVISLASRCPLVVLNDEFPNHAGVTRWTPLERWAVQRADVIMVPSADRIPYLAEEFGLSDQRKRFMEFRNTPKVSHPLEKQDWHALLGIPSGKRIFLNAGTLADWAQVSEILASTAYWPSDAVLLLHSPTPEQEVGYRQTLSHLHIPGRIFWTSAPLSDKLLNSLVAHCNGSFALYRNTGPNISLIGTSSGKLMRSVMCGSPVIASSFDSLRFVSQAGIGVQVCHPSEIPAAIQELIRNEQVYREKCISFAADELMREQQNWEALVTGLSDKIDLRKATHNQTRSIFSMLP
jgi:glycosyltransferase involved in cell wall biosynthesis